MTETIVLSEGPTAIVIPKPRPGDTIELGTLKLPGKPLCAWCESPYTHVLIEIKLTFIKNKDVKRCDING